MWPAERTRVSLSTPRGTSSPFGHRRASILCSHPVEAIKTKISTKSRPAGPSRMSFSSRPLTRRCQINGSRDGRFIVYSELDPKTRWDLWVLPARPKRRQAHSLFADGVQRVSGPALAGQPMDGVHFGRVRAARGVRAAFSRLRWLVEGFNRGRGATALAGRRQGAVLRGSRWKDDGCRGESGDRTQTFISTGRSRAAVRDAYRRGSLLAVPV